METQKFDIFFQKSSKFEFWLLTKSWNHRNFVNISPTLVIDTSMERSSRVLHHGNQKIWFFLKFDLNMHLYVDIGDASSSLWGSTSSSIYKLLHEPWFPWRLEWASESVVVWGWTGIRMGGDGVVGVRGCWHRTADSTVPSVSSGGGPQSRLWGGTAQPFGGIRSQSPEPCSGSPSFSRCD